MIRRIIGDSSMELNSNIRKEGDFRLAAFTISIEDDHLKDEGHINIKDFLDRMEKSREVPKTAAPSPQAFYQAMEGADQVFIVTLSKKLSSSYQNALLALSQKMEEDPSFEGHVFDSHSASAGETLVSLKIADGIRKNLPFKDIVDRVERFLKSSRTLFVLDNLENLVKNGRISKISETFAKALSIKPICTERDGEIVIMGKSRGMKKALRRMVEEIGEVCNNCEGKALVISHVDSENAAERLADSLRARYPFYRIEITKTGLLSSLYANRGGIIVSF